MIQNGVLPKGRKSRRKYNEEAFENAQKKGPVGID